MGNTLHCRRCCSQGQRSATEGRGIQPACNAQLCGTQPGTAHTLCSAFCPHQLGIRAGQGSGAVDIPHPAQLSTLCQYIGTISCSPIQLPTEPGKTQRFQSCEHGEGTETGMSQMQWVSITNLRSVKRSRILGAPPCNATSEELFGTHFWGAKIPHVLQEAPGTAQALLSCDREGTARCPSSLGAHHCPGMPRTSSVGCQMSKGDPWGTLLQEAI